MNNPIVFGDAAHKALVSATRISVIGRSGGGKSTFSKTASEKLKLRYVPMDRDMFWLPGWERRPSGDVRDLLSDQVRQDRWVIDGTNPSNFDIRLPRTELIVWFHLPTLTSLVSVYRRALASYGEVREELAEGCPEKLPDRAFITYIWHFEKKYMPRVKSAIDAHGPDRPILPITSRRQANWFIRRLNSLD
ncbi:MAG: AAA family ATPase [Pseudomonadota bacterium]